MSARVLMAKTSLDGHWRGINMVARATAAIVPWWSDLDGYAADGYLAIAPAVELNGYQYRAVFANSAGSATTACASLPP